MKKKRNWVSDVTEEELDLETEDHEQDDELLEEEVNEITGDEELEVAEDELFFVDFNEEFDLTEEEDESDDGAEVTEEDDNADYDDESDDDSEDIEVEEIDVTHETDDLEELDFDFDDVVPSITKTVSRIPEAGVLTVVNSEKNGNRVAIAREVHQKLRETPSIQIGFTKGCMLLGEHLGDSYTSHPLKKQGAKQIIYNKELVQQITAHMQLDFSDRTSITFHTVTYKKRDGHVIAIISL